MINITKKICDLAKDAGNIVMKFYLSKKLIKISYKENNTPVTNVDYEANKIIVEGLSLITPDIPIISEEKLISFDVYKFWKNYWLIDPLDGTKEFLNNNGEFTINISLIKNNVPILGVIYAPFLRVLYFSDSFNSWKEDKNGILKKIQVVHSTYPLVLVSRSHYDIKINNYLKTINNYHVKKVGSSLKFCLIAEGKAQIYPRFGDTYIWDTAAGHAILITAHGGIKTWKGDNLNYVLTSSLINPGFCVCSS